MWLHTTWSNLAGIQWYDEISNCCIIQRDQRNMAKEPHSLANDHTRPLRKKKTNTSNSVLLRNERRRIQHSETALQKFHPSVPCFPKAGFRIPHPFLLTIHDFPHFSRRWVKSADETALLNDQRIDQQTILQKKRTRCRHVCTFSKF